VRPSAECYPCFVISKIGLGASESPWSIGFFMNGMILSRQKCGVMQCGVYLGEGGLKFGSHVRDFGSVVRVEKEATSNSTRSPDITKFRALSTSEEILQNIDHRSAHRIYKYWPYLQRQASTHHIQIYRNGERHRRSPRPSRANQRYEGSKRCHGLRLVSDVTYRALLLA
jgi:hypothetical protein